MAVNRADYGRRRRPPKYVDVALDFDLEPHGSSVGLVTNEAAVAQFLRCLMLTQQGEWAFESDNGTRIPQQLFGLSDTPAILTLTETIKIALRSKAPMVNLLNLKTKKSPNEDKVEIEIYWSMETNPERINTTLVRVLTQVG